MNNTSQMTGRIASNLSFPTREWYGGIEYKMPKALSKQIIATYKGERKNTQDILKDYVNENCKIKGKCIRVITDL